MTDTDIARTDQYALDAAQNRADLIRDSTAQRAALIAEGLASRDWQTLGYPSLEHWYQDVAGDGAVPAETRKQLAAVLRDGGLSLRRIADLLCVSHHTIERDLAPPREEDDWPIRTGRITGRDGKTYPPTIPHHRPASGQPQETVEEPILPMTPPDPASVAERDAWLAAGGPERSWTTGTPGEQVSHDETPDDTDQSHQLDVLLTALQVAVDAAETLAPPLTMPLGHRAALARLTYLMDQLA